MVRLLGVSVAPRLGLAISKQLVGLMGGSIVAESRLGEGSTFRLELPLPLDLQSQTDREPAADLLGARVLIVDGDAVNRRVLHQQSIEWGVRGASCAGGVQALETLRVGLLDQDPYEVVIVNDRTSGMDGATLAAAIKSDPSLRGTVVVMLTSIGTANDVRNMAECDACLVKPVRQSQDVADVDCCNRKSTRRSPAPRQQRRRPLARESRPSPRTAG